ncbi:hypothetical protein ACSUZJ_07480 [Telluria sp. B2]
MSVLDRQLGAVILALVLLLAAGFWFCHYGAEQYQQGYDAAVRDGKEQRERAAEASRKIETHLRAQLRAQDADALEREEEYEANLAAAQRRVRAGVDRLRCPVGPVPASAVPGDRPAAGGLEADGPGPAIVPEVAGEILGDGAAIAGLVRRYARLEQRFDECEALRARQ